jgi:hypothetical protein
MQMPNAPRTGLYLCGLAEHSSCWICVAAVWDE